MPRPTNFRHVCVPVGCTIFKPAGVPTKALEQVVLTIDELEAMRLADVEGQYQQQAAEQMRVSRRTFGRIIDSARHKVARALTQGMALRIEGGVVKQIASREFRCGDCGHVWHLPFNGQRPSGCSQCEGQNIGRQDTPSSGD